MQSTVEDAQIDQYLCYIENALHIDNDSCNVKSRLKNVYFRITEFLYFTDPTYSRFLREMGFEETAEIEEDYLDEESENENEDIEDEMSENEESEIESSENEESEDDESIKNMESMTI